MRYTATIAGLLLCAAVFVASSSTSHAESNNTNIIQQGLEDPIYSGIEKSEPDAAEVKSKAKAEPSPKQYSVKSGDTLSKIAGKNKSSWQRIYAKNKQLKDPNVIKIGQKLTIPSPNEKLPKRSLPTVAFRPQAINASSVSSSPSKPINPGSSAGNTYSYGYCTWYVKNRRPDLPNNLGDADTWVARASAQGLPTGSKPRVGAVGQQGMHVVYVEKVNKDGTVLISEMNYEGWNVINKRTAPANSFLYIY